MTILSIQPFKALYVLLSVLYELSRFPLWVLLYILPAGRPHPQWTLQQAIRIRVVKLFLKHSATVRVKTPLSLKPGKEGDRFTVIKAQDDWAYTGPAVDAEVKPEDIGAVWFPDALQRSQAREADVVLHFHGGAFVIGDARDQYSGYLTRTLQKHGRVTHVLAPDYRLASNGKSGRFPAPLQDAISSYIFLTEKLRVSPSRITLSGDSAGANIVIGLLRYISEHGSNLGLEFPACAWLWSPWVDLEKALEPGAIARAANGSTDYLSEPFAIWGAGSFTEKHGARHAYISPLGHSFECKTPIFLQCGRAEVMYDDQVAIAKQFQTGGTETKLLVQPKAPHDIILIGNILKFEKEAVAAAKQAGEFLHANRLEG